MTDATKITKISKISKKIGFKPPIGEPNKDYFEALMRQRKVETPQNEKIAQENTQNNEKKLNTLFDEVQALNSKINNVTTEPSSHRELLAQSRDVIGQIDTLKNKLETPDLQLKSSVKTVLRNKLSHIDDNLKIALEKAGLEYQPPPKPTSLNRPMDRFLGLLTHAQSGLESLKDDISVWATEKRGQMSPADTLLIQIKVSQIQQEIELFTSMLNKALESTKTLLNVQV